MIFNHWSFAIFFAVVLSLYWLLPTWRAKKTMLLIGSYIFYASFHAPFVLLLMISTIVDWRVGNLLPRLESAARRNVALLASLLTNLGMLAFFKYGGFVQENFIVLAKSAGIVYQPLSWDIVLPVGISYYTFQTLSYTIDIYRGKIAPAKSFTDFALFVAFFPQLVAGPIVRAAMFLPQLAQPELSRFNRSQFGWGAVLFLMGLFGKVVLADRLLAPTVERVFSAAHRAGFADAWTGAIAFSGQIYFDFAGYSLCAIGVALMLGFSIPDNFRFPYAAAGFSDFWRRWHISLSTWLRDYLYISLGGNRGRAIATYRNLALTMLLGGLWHGAAWTFVAWGGLHGVLLIGERLWRRIGGFTRAVERGAGLAAYAALTYIAVCVTWVFFRAQSFSDAFSLLSAMTDLSSQSRYFAENWRDPVVLGFMGVVLVYQFIVRDMTHEEIWRRITPPGRIIALAAMIFLLAATRGEQRAFIYFQF